MYRDQLRQLVADTKVWLQTEYSPRSTAKKPLLPEKKPPEVKTPPSSIPKTPTHQPSLVAPQKVPPFPTPFPQEKKESPSPPKPIAKDPFRLLLEKIAPDYKLRSAPLPDDDAKRARYAWKETQFQAVAAFLFEGTSATQRAFLNQVARATQAALFPAVFSDLATENLVELLSHPSLEWIVASKQTVEQHPELKKRWRHLPHTGESFLDKKRLLLLSPIQAYLDDPGMKKILWNTLRMLRSS